MSNASSIKTRHKSLDMQDTQCVVKKKQDMLTKAKNKFWNFSDSLRQGKSDKEHPKVKTQSTLDYFFKHNNKTDKVQDSRDERPSYGGPLRKQNSVGSYPIKIEITDADEESRISRTRPATICVGRMFSEAEALALERPRKKLSFREPEIMGHKINNVNKNHLPQKHNKIPNAPEIRRSFSESDSMMRRADSIEDLDLEVVCRKHDHFVKINF